MNQQKPLKLRSKLEQKIVDDLRFSEVTWDYESMKIPFSIPTHYIPDFVMPSPANNEEVFLFPEYFIIIEAKGYLDEYTKRKHRAFQKRWPRLDVRFVFENANRRVRKGAKMKYWQWCERYNFPWAAELIPDSWKHEAIEKAWALAKHKGIKL